MTPQEAMSLSDEEVNRRIAEWMGYKIAKKSFGRRTGYRLELNGTAVVSGGGAYGWGWCISEDCWNTAPKFTTSLDACHEAIKRLVFSKRKKYRENLRLIVSIPVHPELVAIEECIDAAASFRSRALVMTIQKEAK